MADGGKVTVWCEDKWSFLGECVRFWFYDENGVLLHSDWRMFAGMGETPFVKGRWYRAKEMPKGAFVIGEFFATEWTPKTFKKAAA